MVNCPELLSVVMHVYYVIQRVDLKGLKHINKKSLIEPQLQINVWKRVFSETQKDTPNIVQNVRLLE